VRRDRKLAFGRYARVRWLVSVAAVALIATGCISPGSHAVSSFGAGGVSPGLYRTLGSGSNPISPPPACTWQRKDSSGTVIGAGGGQSEDFGIYDTTTGPLYAQVLATDASFTTNGCVTFWKVPSPWDKPLATPGQLFGSGDYLVGPEVAPGTYTSTVTGFACHWDRVRNFLGEDSSIIQSGSGETNDTLTVKIDPTDYGFSSDGCGWTKVG
jgi:hypothetical protein